MALRPRVSVGRLGSAGPASLRLADSGRLPIQFGRYHANPQLQNCGDGGGRGRYGSDRGQKHQGGSKGMRVSMSRFPRSLAQTAAKTAVKTGALLALLAPALYSGGAFIAFHG